MEKIDLLKSFLDEYKPASIDPKWIEVRTHQYLSIEGHGDPNNNPQYSQAVGALFGLAYALKFMVKKGKLDIDYGVMPLEGLWWADDMKEFSLEDRGNWHWKMLILQPDFITADMVTTAQADVIRKKATPKTDQIHFEVINEGLCAQIFHQGGYGAAETLSVNHLHQFILESGYQRAGIHHEVYLNSPTRVPVEKLKTLIRQPVSK